MRPTRSLSSAGQTVRQRRGEWEWSGHSPLPKALLILTQGAHLPRNPSAGFINLKTHQNRGAEIHLLSRLCGIGSQRSKSTKPDKAPKSDPGLSWHRANKPGVFSSGRAYKNSFQIRARPQKFILSTAEIKSDISVLNR